MPRNKSIRAAPQPGRSLPNKPRDQPTIETCADWQTDTRDEGDKDRCLGTTRQWAMSDPSPPTPLRCEGRRASPWASRRRTWETHSTKRQVTNRQVSHGVPNLSSAGACLLVVITVFTLCYSGASTSCRSDRKAWAADPRDRRAAPRTCTGRFHGYFTHWDSASSANLRIYVRLFKILGKTKRISIGYCCHYVFTADIMNEILILWWCLLIIILTCWSVCLWK